MDTLPVARKVGVRPFSTTCVPRLGEAASRREIVVAGDASGKAHLLIPESNQPGDWKYREETLAEPGGTVGQLTVGDINGDGWAEVFVPAYDRDLILAYTFAPPSS